MAARLERSPAAVEFGHSQEQLDKATKAIARELQGGSHPVQEVIAALVTVDDLDPVVAQKAIVAAVRRGDLIMDQEFNLSLA